MAEISKDILEQYCAMKEEAKDLRERIDKGEKYLRKMQEKGYQVAENMNRRFPKKRNPYTADSCRMAHNRYLEKCN